jgi:hypothetical protein
MSIHVNKKKVLLISGIVVLVLAAAAPGVYFYTKFTNLEKLVARPAGQTNVDITALLAKIGKFVDLPTGEVPTVATITEADKLPKQLFYAKAKNGDMVIVFAAAKKAILYDPAANRILEMGPVLIPTPTPTGSDLTAILNETGTPSASPKPVTPTPTSIQVTISPQ